MLRKFLKKRKAGHNRRMVKAIERRKPLGPEEVLERELREEAEEE